MFKPPSPALWQPDRDTLFPFPRSIWILFGLDIFKVVDPFHLFNSSDLPSHKLCEGPRHYRPPLTFVEWDRSPKDGPTNTWCVRNRLSPREELYRDILNDKEPTFEDDEGGFSFEESEARMEFDEVYAYVYGKGRVWESIFDTDPLFHTYEYDEMF